MVTFDEALKQLNCGNVERFILQLLAGRPYLKHKARLLCLVIDFTPSVNALFERFQVWQAVKDDICENILLKHVIKITMCMLA